MTVYLGVSSRGAEPYRIDEPDDLDMAIEAEANTIASDAGSDLLESPEQWCRDELRDQVAGNMTRALRGPGDSYTDPTGVVYTLYEREEG